MRNSFNILSVCLFFISVSLGAQGIKDNYSSSSVLSSGVWYKIAVTADGVYRIDYSTIKQLGLENPSNPRIFGNNFGQLSYYNDDPGPDDLKELSIYMSTGSDGIFNEGDYVLFYAQGTGRWTYNKSERLYEHIHHNYSDTAYYFLTSGSVKGKQIAESVAPLGSANYFSSVSDALFIHEKDEVNLIQSGREWYQQISALHIDPGFTNIITSENINYHLRVVARASVPTYFRFNEGNTVRNKATVQGVNLFDYTGTYAQITDSTGSFMPSTSSPVFDITFLNNGETSANGWLDYLTLQGRKANVFDGTTTQFSDFKSVAAGNITEFTIQNSVNSTMLWDVTDQFVPKIISYSKNGNNIVFNSATDSLRTFIAFTLSGTLAPIIKGTPIANQNLHASPDADMIIVTHPLFRSYAEKLADIHYAKNGLISQIVTPGQIYNEFSGGIADISAIRNYLRMKYLRQSGGSHPLKYVLLFGDGSYENKTLPPDNPNFIPTYQSENSTVIVSSFTSDDFYGLLEDGEGEGDGTLDVGVGRLPVSDTTQAGIVISKIRKYLDSGNMGPWKNIICLTADDEDGNTHMSDAEGLAEVINDSVPAYNIDKIYLDAYKQTTTASGDSYPDVNKAIDNRINSGCLIFNYTGHGSENGLAAERVIKTEDISSWNNGGRLPLFITATCEFSRFDDIDINTVTGKKTPKSSGGELVLLNSNGGGIALMSTTRVVYSAPNFNLNRNIFSCAFGRDNAGNSMTFGDIIKTAKNNSGTGANKRNFTLLGDPALKLAYPYYGKVITDSINGVSANGNIDSLKALSVIAVAGHIEDPDGKLFSSFGGDIYALVYDKATKIKTLANDGGPTMTFNLRNNILYSGKTKAENGKFRFSFIVPRDINYSFGQGKISYYAMNGTEDMNGSFDNITVGGFYNNPGVDTAGPEIKLYMNDTLFKDGGITGEDPVFLALVSDKNGINTTGAGIGHDITAYLDNDSNNSIVLNNYFENDFDSYTSGNILYDLSGLSEGIHKITLKVWDNYNNSSEKTLTFQVLTGKKFVLKNLLNYPNPFSSGTTFTLEHNRPEIDLHVTISIYNFRGEIVRIIKSDLMSSGYMLPPMTWDGSTEQGQKAGKGIYPYRIEIITESGEKATVSGRMIIF